MTFFSRLDDLKPCDRIMLREGIPTVRFADKECREKTADVVTEFLGYLSCLSRI